MNAKSKHMLIALALFVGIPIQLFAQGTAFTYQGRLNAGGTPANGLYDFRFRLCCDPLGNDQIGAPFFTNAIPAINGRFMTTVDFGPGAFAGGNGWLEVDVRTNGAGGYTPLKPLEAVTPAPLAICAQGVSGGLSGQDNTAGGVEPVGCGGEGNTASQCVTSSRPEEPATNILVLNPSGNASLFDTLARGSAAFKPGEGGKHIPNEGESDMALAGVQGLNQKMATEAKINDVALAGLRQTVDQLMADIKATNQKLNQEHN